MDTTYKATVNQHMVFDISTLDITGLDLLQISSDSYHILQRHLSINAKLLESDFNGKQYTFEVNNTKYRVDLSDNLDMLIKEMGFALSSNKNITSIEAPMPGLILEINVREGQVVQEDEPLLILEAMKMENVISSPRNGTIKSIAVAQGDAVDKKNLLIEFE